MYSKVYLKFWFSYCANINEYKAKVIKLKHNNRILLYNTINYIAFQSTIAQNLQLIFFTFHNKSHECTRAVSISKFYFEKIHKNRLGFLCNIYKIYFLFAF